MHKVIKIKYRDGTKRYYVLEIHPNDMPCKVKAFSSTREEAEKERRRLDNLDETSETE